MAAPKAGSRTIVIEGQQFLWRVRKKISYNQGLGASLAFSVQHVDGKSLLYVYANSPRPDNWLERIGVVITPAIVAREVRTALSGGWKPLENGPPRDQKMPGKELD